MNRNQRSGYYVMMSAALVKNLCANGSRAHAKEFQDCVGVVCGLVNYNDPSCAVVDDSKFGPEVNVRWMPGMWRYGYNPAFLYEVFSIKRLHTKQLLTWKNNCYRFPYDMSSVEFADKIKAGQKVIDGELWGNDFTLEQIKEELALRPHVPNKRESRGIRIKNKKSSVKRGKADR